MGTTESTEAVVEEVMAEIAQREEVPPRRCDILVVGAKSGDEALTELRWLPTKAHIVGTNLTLEEFERDGINLMQANVLFNASGNATTLAPIIAKMPRLEWIHSMSAGIEHILFPELIEDDKVVMTNAKGVFSSSLAEYVMGVISYFSKDFPRLMRQKQDHKWERYCVKEIRGTTMGIIGYGDIGKSCAKLAKAYGMKVIAMRRRPDLSKSDPFVDAVYGREEINTIMSQSDYIVLVAPLTPETRHMIGEKEFESAKIGQVFINIGRGPLIDEDAFIKALTKGDRLHGAALDVFHTEPLPKDSTIWDLPNLLLSPHNADMTSTFRHESTRFFTENCKRYLDNMELEAIVDKRAGY